LIDVEERHQQQQPGYRFAREDLPAIFAREDLPARFAIEAVR
jgi:hypothetical protein